MKEWGWELNGLKSRPMNKRYKEAWWCRGVVKTQLGKKGSRLGNGKRSAQSLRTGRIGLSKGARRRRRMSNIANVWRDRSKNIEE